jgi:FG-GAP repeat protein
MSRYAIAHEADLGRYPNYSFEIGDVDGDGRSEVVCFNQNGNRLRVVNLDGRAQLGRGRF